ncbi:MAG: NAD-dependent epimerase/dehydratase family protein [Deltaproteobacteria bacterium]|nr:MAG: NAD-dependent epimerase/dehydratase family protein [Deltaproteobacteria bacterium]
MTTLAIIGATGKVAKHAVRHALEAGYQVKALARSPENIGIEHPNLTTFQGDVGDPSTLEPAIQGADLVLSCIGNRSKDKGVIIERGTQNILDVMKTHNVQRMALISSVGVGNSRGQLGNLGIRGYIFGAMFFTLMNKLRKDLLGAEERAMSSDRDVVIVRPVELIEAPGAGTWTATDHKGKLGGKITRDDVGKFMVSLAETTEYDNQAVSLGGALS